jgi:hypothetical protein
VTGSTSVGEEISKISSLQIFPNPFSQSIKVNLNLAKQTDNLELRLVNTLGQVVVNDLYQRLPSGNHLLGMGNSKISEGIYFLQVVLDGEKVSSKKIVKVK